jgi:hypothetical protein
MTGRNEKAINGRKCYDHLGGKLGTLIFEKFVELEWIKLEEGKSTVYEITEKGSEELTKIGIDLE